MEKKLIAALACAAALALGACSGNNASGTTGGGGTGGGSGTNGGPDDGNGNGDSNGGAASPPLQTAQAEYDKAQSAVTRAVAAANLAVTSGTEAARTNAEQLIAAASMALAEAVRAADAAVAATEDGSGAQVGAAARLSRQARTLQSEQTDVLDHALDPLSWYGRALARQMIPRGQVSIPRDGTNTATIERTPRTIPTSASDSTQQVNPDAFTSTTFKDVKYSAGRYVVLQQRR